MKEYGVNVSRYALSGMLPAMKRERLYTWLKDAHSQVLHSALLHLDTAFKNFFAKWAKFPRFKKKSGKQSCQFNIRKWDCTVCRTTHDLDKEGIIKLKTEGYTVSARRGFNEREALFIALA